MGKPAELEAFAIIAPRKWTRPVIFNSPHSGRVYPAEFLAASRLNPHALRKSEDCYIDELFSFVADLGSPLLHAHFPRAFLDVNREPYELDPRMFREELPGFANSSSMRVAGGLGTIPRIVSEGDEIYRGPLKLIDALARIETIYRPYHRTLADLINRARDAFGYSLLIDCHSMPSTACSHVTPHQAGRVDIVLGDRHGVACADEIVSTLEELIRSQGLRVLRNKPYSGGFITQNYGSPNHHRHALQIEINRALYLDERSLERNRGYAAVKLTLHRIFAGLLASLPDIMQPRREAAE
ncbi:N-formylglutamate amidohydrolase [Aestuariivirga sp. YIM B02566]|uniref:N-formylglutamate amidohydrolase n=1 Tax=Taklimakanibacter albus TaxID=2800327 RepID=UPI001AEDF066|nr:N-formylglutamate amidohydrolase [Aestuariivirga sp. YIM B02566]